MYRSTDGGRSFEAWAGAPSGDDFHVLWINPAKTENMILGVDQGAIISVDGGNSWSSWYNQPTGQFYHVSTDQHFPYYVYSAQQDSGTAAVPSRSDYGEITYRDWAPTGGFEFCYIAPDPANPNYVYAGGWYGTVLRYDKTTGQIVHLLVRTPKYRDASLWTSTTVITDNRSWKTRIALVAARPVPKIRIRPAISAGYPGGMKAVGPDGKKKGDE